MSIAVFKRVDLTVTLPKPTGIKTPKTVSDAKRIREGKPPRLFIDNRSEWPTEFLGLVAYFVASQLPIDDNDLRFVMQSINRRGYRGRALLDGIQFNCACHRRARAKQLKYYKYDHATEFEAHSPVEVLVHLIAHEMYHTTREGASWFAPNRENYLRTGQMAMSDRYNRSRGEVMTDRKSFEVVRAWREWGREEVTRGYLRCLRLMREKQRQRMNIEAARKAEKNSTSHKIEKAEAKLAEWEKKRDHAETYIAKYRRKLRALRAAQTRKLNAAAKGGER